MENCIHHWCFLQWLFPKGMALLAMPMSQKSPRDKFLGERLRALSGTIGGAVIFVAGVTTLGSCDEYRDSLTWAGTLFTSAYDLF
jgi:hypothetical protein